MLKRLSGRKMTPRLSKNEDVFNHFFTSFVDDFFTADSNCEKQLNSFKVDILEDVNNYWIEADLPGFSLEDVKIRYENQYLTITAQRTTTSEITTSHFIRRERQQGTFSRSFYIEHIREDAIAIKLTNGLLRIQIPKDEAI